MPPRPHRPDALTWQVFRGSDAVRDGLLTEHQLRSSAWVRLRHDVYADARLDRDHALACRAALLRLPSGVMIAGPSAAYLHGVEHAAAFTDDVHVLVPRPLRIGPQRGLRVHVNASTPLSTVESPGRAGSMPNPCRATNDNRTPDHARRLTHPGRAAVAGRPPGLSRTPDADSLRRVGRQTAVGMPPGRTRQMPGPAALSVETGSVALPRSDDDRRVDTPGPPWEPGGRIPRSDPGRSAWETAVWLDPVRAVAIVDSLLGQGLTDRDTLGALAAGNADRPGGRRARWLFDLADGSAQSPPESHLRVRLVLGGLPRPVVQLPVYLANGVVLHPNLAWPEFRVAVEYDGQWHSDADQLHRDRRRLNLLVGAGWLVLHVTSRRLHGEFPAVLGEVRAALASRGWRR
ncbi:hypothetical protein AB0C01_09140 [Micromonospora sp. NPDC048905]|uniref:hypothetical protein n=1 Tax=Micromonospora sp. NPDC048905 TaxID=3155494 RepID=UPI0033D966D7